MAVQAGLCQTCSETTLLVFPQGGSFLFSHLLRVVEVEMKVQEFIQLNLESQPRHKVGERGKHKIMHFYNTPDEQED